MKPLIRSIFLVGAMLVASSVFAAENMYLTIEKVKGGGKKVVPCPNGVCTISDLAPGEYTVSVCSAEGKALTDDSAKSAVISPRDVATGQSSGKRQHGSIRITKEWSASSPQLGIAIDEPGVQVALIINTTRSNIKK